MYFRLLLLTGILLLLLSFSIAQQSHLSKEVEKLHNYSRNRPEEKVYLHFDKDYYVAGETIWFKNYITLGADHFPSAQSQLLYVDFYDQQNNFVDQLLIRCENGFGNGHFDLPADLQGAQLRVKAYTSWMKNFNTDFIFQKGITLVNNEHLISLPQTKPTVGFYPEGGEMIADVVNRVAIKTNLNMTDETFWLIDSNNQQLKEVQVDERGYGQFTIKPEAQELYYLSYKGEEFELPTPASEGISMTLNNYSYPDNARLTLRKKHGGSLNKVSVVVHTRGTVHFTNEVDFSRAVAITNIPKDILPRGVNHLTIFDNTGTPLAERLFYIDRTDPITMEVDASNKTISTRKRVTLNLDLSDITGQNELQSNLSVSVTQRGEIDYGAHQEDIKTYLLLNSDLRGQIEDPGYYFCNKSKEKKQALDLVMMTHGWRRFTWDKILNQSLDSIQYEPEKGVTIKGRMVHKGTRKPVVNGSITYLNSQSGRLTMRNGITDEAGQFILTDLSHSQEDSISLKGVISKKGLKRKGKQFVGFEIDSLLEILDTPWLLAPNTTAASAQFFDHSQILANAQKRNLYDSIYNFDPEIRVVRGVTIEANKVASPNEVSGIYGKGTVTIKIPNEVRAESTSNILTYLQGKVPGLLIIPHMPPHGSTVQLRSNVRIGSTEEMQIAEILPPKFVLNDMPSSLFDIAYIPVAEISRVEVFKGPDALAHGLNTIGGVIAVYTKTGFDADITPTIEEGLYTLQLPGFQAPREFFSPDYATAKPEHAKPDIRNLIHWQPYVVTDSTGHAEIEFWTSDNTGIIDINIQGLTYSGKPVVRHALIEVKEEDEEQ